MDLPPEGSHAEASRRILITGSRHWQDAHAVAVALEQEGQILGGCAGTTLVTSGRPMGVDVLSAHAGKELGMTVEEHPEVWELRGLAARARRNAAMVALGADVCLAFPLAGSKGTSDCIKRARKAGMRVVVVTAVT